MEEKIVIQHIKPHQQNPILYQKCAEMWSSIFEDSDRYVSWYFNSKWKISDTLLLSHEAGELCSMIHLNPYPVVVEGREYLLHYIVGVCTRTGQRKKGYMGLLLQKAFSWMYERKEPFTYLMPASQKIYEPYDFCEIYQAVGQKCRLGRDGGQSDQYQFKNYEEAMAEEKRQLVSFSEKMLKAKFQVYARRSEEYFAEIAEEMKACLGELLLIYQEGQFTGYLEYGLEDGRAEVFEVAGQMEEKGLLDSLGNYLCQKQGWGSIECQINESSFLENSSRKCHTIMARIIHFETCAFLLRSREALKLSLEIHDSQIAGNNGKWMLEANQKECIVSRLAEDALVEKKMEIGEFCDYLFREKSVYLNELV